MSIQPLHSPELVTMLRIAASLERIEKLMERDADEREPPRSRRVRKVLPKGQRRASS